MFSGKINMTLVNDAPDERELKAMPQMKLYDLAFFTQE